METPHDNDEEPDETFTVTLSARTGKTLPAGVRIADATATGTILNDDVAVRVGSGIVKGQVGAF